MNRTLTVVAAVACAIVAACGGKEGSSGPIGPLTRTPTVVIDDVTTSITTQTFPNQMVKAIGSGKDSQGNPITSGFTWEIDGKMISSDQSFEIPLAPGTYQVCLSALGTKTCKTVTVTEPSPVVVEAFIAQSGPNGPQSIALKACVRQEIGGETHCQNLDPLTLTASIKTKFSVLDEPLVSVECQQAGCDILGSIARVKRNDLQTPRRFVVLNRKWTIPSGKWAGITVDISPERGFAEAMGGFRFYSAWKVTGGWIYRPYTWPSKSLPIPIAFNRDRSDTMISSADSTTFWKIVSDYNFEFGMQVFRPANIGELKVTTDTGQRFSHHIGGVGVQVLSTLDNSYGGWITDGQGGSDIIGGGIYMRTHPLVSMTSPFAVKHELTHTLGFGHASGKYSWNPGIMTDSVSVPRLSPAGSSLIAQEVAHIRSYYAVRELELKHGAYGIGNIHQFERVTLGSPLENIIPEFSSGNGASSAMVVNDQLRTTLWKN